MSYSQEVEYFDPWEESPCRMDQKMIHSEGPTKCQSTERFPDISSFNRQDDSMTLVPFLPVGKQEHRGARAEAKSG